jgi:Mlc titration factor MtfA (ptsG expression regulator)
MLGFFKRRRRKRLREAPFPSHWREILERRVPYYMRLSPRDRRELEGHIQVFLAEKRFEGCAGLEITDEIRLTIAAQACILLLHRDTDYYPGLRTILVYPHRYIATSKAQGPGGVVIETSGVRLGESWHGSLSTAGGGPVILSWDDVRAGAADPRDGHNVVFHEFAHQLDGESGAVEGAPMLERGSLYATWARIFSAEFERLRVDLAWDRATLLGSYAATSPAEFFAVATEFFFERPAALRARHPQLYAQLAAFYRQDPAQLEPARSPAAP